MKISIIGSRGYPCAYSGYETFVKELSERLVAKGYRVTVYCHRNLFKTFPRSVQGVDLVYLPALECKILSQLSHSLLAFIHACFDNSDIILVLNAANGPFGILTRLFRKKTVINVDGLEWLRPKWRGLGARYFYWAAKMSTKFYDSVITDSLEMRKIYQKEFKASSVTITYGADIFFSKDPSLIKKWGLEKDGYYLIAGRIIPDNNTGFILEEFLKSRSSKKIVCAGEAFFKDEFSRKILSINDKRVIFTGLILERETVFELFANSFSYLHGHEFGGTNPVLLEALGCGAAAVVLDTAFNREVVKGQDYGILFKKEKGSLKEIIENIENNPSQLVELRKKARGRIREEYNWEKIVLEYSELFDKIKNK